MWSMPMDIYKQQTQLLLNAIYFDGENRIFVWKNYSMRSCLKL